MESSAGSPETATELIGRAIGAMETLAGLIVGAASSDPVYFAADAVLEIGAALRSFELNVEVLLAAYRDGRAAAIAAPPRRLQLVSRL